MWSFNVPWPVPDPLNDAVHLDGPACTGDWQQIDEDPNGGRGGGAMVQREGRQCSCWSAVILSTAQGPRTGKLTT